MNKNQNPQLHGLHQTALRLAEKNTRRGSLGYIIIEPDDDTEYDNMSMEEYQRRLKNAKEKAAKGN